MSKLIPPAVRLSDIKQWLQPGDRLTCTRIPGKTLTLTKLQSIGYSAVTENHADAVLFDDDIVELISPRWELVWAGQPLHAGDILLGNGLLGKWGGSLPHSHHDRWRLTRDETTQQPDQLIHDPPLRATRKDVRVGMRVEIPEEGDHPAIIGDVTYANERRFIVNSYNCQKDLNAAMEPVLIHSEPAIIVVDNGSLLPGDVVEYLSDGSQDKTAHNTKDSRVPPFTVVRAPMGGYSAELKDTKGHVCYAPRFWTMRLLSRGAQKQEGDGIVKVDEYSVATGDVVEYVSRPDGTRSSALSSLGRLTIGKRLNTGDGWDARKANGKPSGFLVRDGATVRVISRAQLQLLQQLTGKDLNVGDRMWFVGCDGLSQETAAAWNKEAPSGFIVTAIARNNGERWMNPGYICQPHWPVVLISRAGAQLQTAATTEAKSEELPLPPTHCPRCKAPLNGRKLRGSLKICGDCVGYLGSRKRGNYAPSSGPSPTYGADPRALEHHLTHDVDTGIPDWN